MAPSVIAMQAAHRRGTCELQHASRAPALSS